MACTSAAESLAVVDSVSMNVFRPSTLLSVTPVIPAAR